VRFDPDTAWEDHPGTVPGEVAGTCRTCADLVKAERERERVREDKRLLRDRARGYGPPAEGEDIWRGFKEG
jgi:hypothetical protein